MEIRTDAYDMNGPIGLEQKLYTHVENALAKAHECRQAN